MAKATKSAAEKPATPRKEKVSRKAVASPAESIEKAALLSLSKLQDLNLEHGLQSEIEWCLGSFRADGNPIGLYEKVEATLIVFRAERDKKTKGVTAKLITELETALSGR
ncbi:MAG: hypothetical protein K1X47_10185 [Cyclobacteriaceae bacterium]|nr:hypothetical protein [Cyclobacteriaceae bacterium]